MDDRQLRQWAQDHLIRTGLLIDVVPPWEGPIFVRAQGSVIVDTAGKEYLDFNSGQMCSALGHNNPRVVKAIQEAATTLTHASSVYYNVPQIQLAKRLGDLVDRPLAKSMFIQSGADSNEGAILLARRYTGRPNVAAFHLSFHGYSDVTRAMSFCATAPGYGPTMPGIFAFPTPYCYRCRYRSGGDECCTASLTIGLEVLDRQCPAGTLAAIIVEPLVSAGGVIELPPGFLAALRRECDKRGALLILDEAQTGLAKLGTMFGYQQEGVVPDIMTLSKHLGGGLAVSAVVTTPAIEERATAGGMIFGHSHSGDPLACAAAVASIDEIVAENLPQRAREIGQRWQSLMGELQKRHELIGDIRGRGLLQGVELVRDRETKEPAIRETTKIFQECVRNGLLFSVRGLHRNVLRFVPPFTTTPAQLEQGAQILEDAIRRA
ncbi:MAG: aspartate aminotransferase family protein [Candidatus Rokubacteria bacterium]|nr:aspartate aminotransferase family protein [Candidatus Rokubacteria bacterium]